MTYKEKIKAKVIKLRDELVNGNYGTILSQTVYRYFNKVNEFIDSLPEEPVREDLDEAAKEVGQRYFPDAYNIWARPNIEAECAALAFKEGANWQKQQMMKEAVEGVYDCDNDNSWIEFKGWAESTSEAGCKVKVIIINED